MAVLRSRSNRRLSAARGKLEGFAPQRATHSTSLVLAPPGRLRGLQLLVARAPPGAANDRLNVKGLPAALRRLTLSPERAALLPRRHSRRCTIGQSRIASASPPAPWRARPAPW